MEENQREAYWGGTLAVGSQKKKKPNMEEGVAPYKAKEF